MSEKAFLPDVYIFNASNDVALAVNSPSFTPPAILKKLEDDLAVIPMLFARAGDIVVVEQIPDDDYIAYVKDLGFNIPTFICKKDFFNNSYFNHNSFNTIKPWGWSLSIHRQFKDVKTRTTDSFKKSVNASYDPILRELSGRKTANNVLQGILAHEFPFCVGFTSLPVEVDDINDVDRLFAKWTRVVVKEPWSSSGRGVYILTGSSIDSYARKNIESAIKKQGYVMVEPWFNRIVDLSFLYSISPDGVNFLGESVFLTKNGGQYEGSYIHYNKIDKDTSLFLSSVLSSDFINVLAEGLRSVGFSRYYEGWIGVDAMIVNSNGLMLLHPCLEVNCRYTMGHVAYVLKCRVDPSVTVVLKVGSLDEYRLARAGKVCLKSFNGLINQGVGAITPVNDTTRFVCWVEVL